MIDDPCIKGMGLLSVKQYPDCCSLMYTSILYGLETEKHLKYGLD